MRALIIEDTELVALLIADGLKDLGFDDVVCASTTRQAINLAAQKCPDLITADDRLVDGSGVDAVRIICKDRFIPVLYIVALPEDVLKEEPLALVLEKPFSSRQLSTAVHQATSVLF